MLLYLVNFQKEAVVCSF